MKRFVFDFETLGQKPSAVVLSAALTFFDDKIKTFDEYVNSTYYWKFDVDNQIKKYGRTIDERTLDWWSKQDDDVRNSQFKQTDNDITLVEFVNQLKDALDENGVDKHTLAFVRGQSFDFPILASIVDDVKSEIKSFDLNPELFPVPFWNQRDIRTYIGGLFLDPTKTKCPLPNGVLKDFKLHNPIHDNALAILMILYAEAYASEEIEFPDESDWDERSLK